MPTDYYDTIYQKKINYDGSNLQEKAITRGLQEFDRYLATTPTRQEVLRNGKSIYVSVQRSHQTLVGDRYEKDILGKLEDNLKVGDIFEWADEKWIILTQQRLSIPSHFRGKIRLCNYYLKWNHGGQIYETPGHIITSRAFALEEGQKAGLVWEEGNMVVLAIVPSNIETNTITRYNRFILKGRAWRVVSTDILSIDNLIFIRLEEDQINLATDDLENGLADKYRPDAETSELIEGHIYDIVGPAKLVSNQIGTYTGTSDGETAASVIFSIDDEDLAVLNAESTTNPISIRANNKGLVGVFNITCEFVDTGKIVTRNIKVTSMWG